MSTVYNFKEYDKYLCLKPSLGMWLSILFLLRPFVILLLTFLSGLRGGDRSVMQGLSSAMYPDDLALMLAFVASFPVLVFMYAWVKRKPGAPEYVKKICRNAALILLATAVVNLILVCIPLLVGGIDEIHSSGWMQIGILLCIISYLHSSQRVKDTFDDFPKEEQSSK